jgi:LuxR family maltose regulon positive regulatory protein
VTLAQPEGYVRLFADEGPPMAALLKALTKQSARPGYVRRLLARRRGPSTGPAGRRLSSSR